MKGLILICIGVLFLAVVWAGDVAAGPPAAEPTGGTHETKKRTPFEIARQLEQIGRTKEAFVKYLAIPGAEHLATRLARSQAEAFLGVLGREGDRVPLMRRKLIEGDLLLALDRKADALACYRAAVAGIADEPGKGWAEGLMPRDTYPVEPPHDVYGRYNRPARPMALGPGSHRDNWLIRRFIALEDWDGATKEFRRVWAIHRRTTKPYVVTREVRRQVEGPKAKAVKRKYLVEPSGFDGKGLQFAIDYAYYLRRRGRSDEALKVLAEPLRLIDMDHNPNFERLSRSLTDAEAARYPRGDGGGRDWWCRRGSGGWYVSLWHTMGISRKEFIRLAAGAFRQAGKRDALVALLRQQVDRGHNITRRVLARVLLHEGKVEESLALELAYVEAAKLGAFPGAYRRARVYEEYDKIGEAVAEYERAMKLPLAPPPFPDLDEETVESRAHSGLGGYLPPLAPAESGKAQREEPKKPPDARPATILTAVGPAWRDYGVIDRLKRLYARIGKKDRILEKILKEPSNHNC